MDQKRAETGPNAADWKRGRMKPIFGTNWKMRNARREAAEEYARALDRAPELESLQLLFVMPPATLIRDMADAIFNSRIAIGGQNVHWAEEGEFTGELSTELLKQAGARLVLLGHAERRLLFGETDEIICQKAQRAFADELTVVLCVGDLEKDANNTTIEETLQSQLLADLEGSPVEAFNRLIIAYEPIWAIGARSESAASPGRVAQGVEAVRKGLLRINPSAEFVPILYGGSVNFQNCVDLMSESGVDGLFVGRCAASPEDFLAIIRKSLKALA
jgi:triosephosphate isomerase